MISKMCEMLRKADRTERTEQGTFLRLYAKIEIELQNGNPVTIPGPVYPTRKVTPVGRLEWARGESEFKLLQSVSLFTVVALTWPDPDMQGARLVLAAVNQRLWLGDFTGGNRLNGAPILALEPIIVGPEEGWKEEERADLAREEERNKAWIATMFSKPPCWPAEIAKTWPKGDRPRTALQAPKKK